ncbi:MAG: hypothetical protein ABS897_09305, partial [Eubacteriales bacterium]
MKLFSFRMIVILSVLVIAAAVLPAAAVSEDYTRPDPASVAGAWWESSCYVPPVKVVKQTKVIYRQAETL